MMYVDIKQTMWRRFYIDEEAPIIEDINNEDEVMRYIEDYCYDSETLYETIEDLQIKENNGEATIEVYDDNGDIIWDNVNYKTND